jgi:non-canonical (house-cleaning) NTP pyrophosphatase
MKIVIASTAKQKLDSLNLVLDYVLVSKEGIDILGLKASSLINEQPEGREEIERGCNNRLQSIIKEVQADLYFSIENGIEFIPSKDIWIDYALVKCFALQNGKAYFAFSDYVTFPNACVMEAKKRGFEQWTVGAVMAEFIKGLDKQDPHLWLTGISRVEFLKKPILKIINEMIFDGVNFHNS